jgi:photosystem II stability/assembly factor-like uncharacterized protein
MCERVSVRRCRHVGTATTGYGVVAHTNNGGTSWSPQHLSPVPHAFSAVSCVSTTICIAAGVKVGHTEYWSRTTDGGAHWSDHTGTTAPDIGGLTSVSRTGPMSCSIVGLRGEGAATTIGGATWTIGTASTNVRWIFGESCISSSICVAVGQSNSNRGLALSLTNGGVTWHHMTTPTSVSMLYGVDCLSATICFAVGQSGNHGTLLHTTNGIRWTLMGTPSSASVRKSVSCRSPTWCTAVGGNAANNAVILTLS